MNDGSEESSDFFKVIAITESSKESEPFQVRINIVPVNDETPIVAANTGLCVWEGGTFTFTRNELCKLIDSFIVVHLAVNCYWTYPGLCVPYVFA